jgi:hypothetical protein
MTSLEAIEPAGFGCSQSVRKPESQGLRNGQAFQNRTDPTGRERFCPNLAWRPVQKVEGSGLAEGSSDVLVVSDVH